MNEALVPSLSKALVTEMFEALTTTFDVMFRVAGTLTVPPLSFVTATKSLTDATPSMWVFPVVTPPFVVFGCDTGAVVTTTVPISVIMVLCMLSHCLNVLDSSVFAET